MRLKPINQRASCASFLQAALKTASPSGGENENVKDVLEQTRVIQPNTTMPYGIKKYLPKPFAWLLMGHGFQAKKGEGNMNQLFR
jgi:hypothetical protein